MTLNPENVDTQLLNLPVEERLRLAKLLFLSLEDSNHPEADEEIEEFWIAEANRRYDEFRQGNMGARPADEVLAEARAMLRK